MLTDSAGRRIEHLRLSVTDRCDLRCAYCIPNGFKGYEEPTHWLDFDEIERLVFARLGLNGCGSPEANLCCEPACRNWRADSQPYPASRIWPCPRTAHSLSAMLRPSGATASRGSTVSLDSLNPARVAAISKRDVLPQIMAGLDAARAEGFSQIKINTVALPDLTEDDLDAMVHYCMRNGFILRLIETMPLGDSGRGAGHVDQRPIQARLRARFGLIDGVVSGGGPARYLVSPDGRFQIGFITPLSQHFCNICNRLRLSVDGVLHLCLGQEDTVDFRSLLRGGGSDADIATALADGLDRKPLRHEFRERPERIIRIMASNGG